MISLVRCDITLEFLHHENPAQKGYEPVPLIYRIWHERGVWRLSLRRRATDFTGNQRGDEDAATAGFTNVRRRWLPGDGGRVQSRYAVDQRMVTLVVLRSHIVAKRRPNARVFATVVYLIANSDPKRSTAVSAYIQVIRLGGVELAVSVLNTWIRHREQFHSNSLGLAVSTSSRGFEIYQTELEGVFGRGVHPAEVLSHAASAVRSQAYVLAYADSVEISFWFAVAALLLVACLGPMPFGPLHPRFTHAANNP